MSVTAALTRLDSATDGQLLGRFVQAGDADAFAALVRRLGPTVLAVCRRVCPDSHLAEDAFQAAFLVLAKKAESVKPRERVVVWLHGVAYRTASKARAMLAHRRRREADAPALPDPPAPDPAVPDDDDLRKLDAAIAALPDHLRAAVVLCELDGRSRKDAARQLGIPEGTLSSRLADARKRLGDRLRPAVAVVTAALVARTAEAAVGGSTSETVRSLARGVMSMLLLNKLKLPAVVLGLLLAATVFAVPLFTPARSAPVPKSLKPPVGGIGVTRGGVFYLLQPDGKSTHEFDLEEQWKLQWLDGPCLISPSPDGGFPVAVLVPRGEEVKRQAQLQPKYELRLIRSADDRDGRVIDVGTERLDGHLVWARSGKRFYVNCRGIGEQESGTYLVVDATSGKATPSVVPAGHRLLGEAADGTLVTDEGVANLPLKKQGVANWRRLFRVSADGKTVGPLADCPGDHEYAYDLSPDCGTLLTWVYDRAADADRLTTFDTATGKIATLGPKELDGAGEDGAGVMLFRAKWSPDGKRVGFIYAVRTGRPGVEPTRILYVCDRDGSNGKAVFTWREKGDTLGEIWDAHFEWN